MSRVCGFDTSEALRAPWARIARFERIVSDTCVRQSWFWQPLQPVLGATAVDTYPDYGGSAALSWA